MLRRGLAKFGGKVFLKGEIDTLEHKVYKHRLMQYFILASAGLLGVGSVFLPYQRKELRLLGMGTSSVLGFGGAVICRIREQEELMYSSTIELNHAVHKAEIKNRYAKERIMDDVNRDISVIRNLELNGLPLLAQIKYAERNNIPVELFTDRADAMAILNPKPVQEESTELVKTLYFSGVAEPNKKVIDTVVDPKPRQVLEQLAAENPKLIRLDNYWILELVSATMNPNIGKRFNHHYYISGSTGEGKSILGGVIARLIALNSTKPSIIAGHDPKKIPGMADLSDWLCTFTEGYKIDGYSGAEKWSELIQQLCSIQMKEFSDDPNTGELVLIQDELNTCYGEGKGYGNDISPEEAKDLLSKWLFVITNMRSVKGHLIGMGQSPLSTDTGFKKTSMQNLCFIALGNTATYILNEKNVRSFVYSSSDKDIEALRKAADTLLEAEVRFALVVPTKGLPFIALIPEFDIEGIKSGRLDNELMGVSENEGSYQETDETEEKPSSESEGDDYPSKTAPRNNAKRHPSERRKERMESGDESVAPPNLTPIQEAFEKLFQWYILFHQDNNRYPTDQELFIVWERESGQRLTTRGLAYIREKIDERIAKM